MSWAARRRLVYITGVVAFFAVVIGVPLAYHFLTIPPTCHDGIQNQGETAVDEGGPCLRLNPADLQPEGVLWARTFVVRPGVADAVAYIDNPNQNAAVMQVPYTLDLYDNKNMLVAELSGQTFVMPGGVTPVFVGNISIGNRIPTYAQFRFASALAWERAIGFAQAIKISNLQTSQSASSTQITALATNSSVSDIKNSTFVATAFDPGGNAIATSQTAISDLPSGASEQIYFTWPSAFSSPVGSVDILPVVQPEPDPNAQQ